MNRWKRKRKSRYLFQWMLIFMVVFPASGALGQDLGGIKASGVLRHLGVVYANFVTGRGDGLDVDVMKRFATHLGMSYEFVETRWEDAISDLSGKSITLRDGHVETLGPCVVKGDVLASGLTILSWRKQIVDYSNPTFPTQIWLVVPAQSPVQPIAPTGETSRDIAAVKALLRGRTVLGKAGTCLDPELYQLDKAGAVIRRFEGQINELAPAVILKQEAESVLLEVPDVLMALQKWPGRIKVIGPISERQDMGVAFRKTDSPLREEFDKFFQMLKKNGTYSSVVKEYYPGVFHYFPEFFK